MSDTGRLRAAALSLFESGLAAADPYQAVRRVLAARPRSRSLSRPQSRSQSRPRHILAVGKAARAMMAAALDLDPGLDLDPRRKALVITNDENARPLQGAEVYAAGHPIPDERGLQAGQRLVALLEETGPNDEILLLLSGGGSALIPCPVEGVSLEDKQRTSALMLAAGLPIQTINLVRQNLSKLKGGGLARLAAPARFRSLILSDVIGDEIRAIASGPTAVPLGDRAAARQALVRADLWTQVPRTVQHALTRAETTFAATAAENVIVGSNTKSLETIAAKSGGKIISRALVGDVADAAWQIAQAVQANPDPILLWGGETSVTVTGTGRGGRNQELALRVLQHLHLRDPHSRGESWAFLSGGSDGIDGPTDAAGGLVSSDMGFPLACQTALDNNDAYTALTHLGGLLKTGATGTNVADFQIFVRPALFR